MSCVGVAFSKQALLSICEEQPLVLATFQIDISQSQYWKPPLVTKDGQLGPFLPIIWQFHLDHLHLCIYFSKLLLYLVSMLPLNGSNLSCPHSPSLLLPLHTTSPTLLLTCSFCYNSHPPITIRFYFSNESYLYTLVPYIEPLWFYGL